MIITVEISLYPLTKDYTEHVIKLIRGLKSNNELEIYTTAMSTYIQGDYDVVMKVLQSELKTLYEALPENATVLKIIPKNLNIQDGYLEF